MPPEWMKYEYPKLKNPNPNAATATTLLSSSEKRSGMEPKP